MSIVVVQAGPQGRSYPLVDPAELPSALECLARFTVIDDAITNLVVASDMPGAEQIGEPLSAWLQRALEAGEGVVVQVPPPPITRQSLCAPPEGLSQTILLRASRNLAEALRVMSTAGSFVLAEPAGGWDDVAATAGLSWTALAGAGLVVGALGLLLLGRERGRR